MHGTSLTDAIEHGCDLLPSCDTIKVTCNSKDADSCGDEQGGMRPMRLLNGKRFRQSFRWWFRRAMCHMNVLAPANGHGDPRSMRIIGYLAAAATILVPTPALSWGYEGHKIVALIARSYLTPNVRAKVDAMLAADTDTLTQPDMASRATWADAWRGAGHRESSEWHFVDIELDQPDLAGACYGFPAAAAPASAGPASDCIVDKLREFTVELAAPATPAPERLLALKFVLHFVGDVHQPMHAADNHDRGGNCVLLALGGPRTVNLHSYWDTATVEALGHDPEAVAAQLRGRITPAQKSAWGRGDPATWAQDTFEVGRSTAYRIGSAPGCSSDPVPIALPAGYDIAAHDVAAVQLEKAGVRLAMVLNRSLANVTVASQAAPEPMQSSPEKPTRSPASLACSGEADKRGLHGRERQGFRRSCMRRLGIGA